jgi:hypothetical protein
MFLNEEKPTNEQIKVNIFNIIFNNLKYFNSEFNLLRKQLEEQ